MRWIWIDCFLEFKSGQLARAVKNLSLAEDHFDQHWPGYPVMPAALLLEGLAQTGGILVGEAVGFKEKVVLAKVPRVVFHREVLAGEQLVYDAEVLHMRPEGASTSCRASSGGSEVAEAEIFFAFLDQSRTKQLFGDANFVFTGELKRLIDKLLRAASSGSGVSA